MLFTDRDVSYCLFPDLGPVGSLRECSGDGVPLVLPFLFRSQSSPSTIFHLSSYLI